MHRVAYLFIICSISAAYRLLGGVGLRVCKKLVKFPTLRSSAPSAVSQGSEILRQIKEWACVKSCGACCKLGPLEDRPDLGEYLTPEEYEKYVSMIGPDDWCKHYDKANRLCTIYEDRPAFCRVEIDKFKDMYDIKEDEFSVSYYTHIYY